MTSRLKFWGWGLEKDVLGADEVQRMEAAYAKRFGLGAFRVVPAPKAEEIQLRKPRVQAPGALADVCSTDHFERLLHSYGQSFYDSARTFARDFSNPPDVIAFPHSETDVVSVLDWCDSVGAAEAEPLQALQDTNKILCRGQNCSLHRKRQCNRAEEGLRVEIILARFIDDPDKAALLRRGIKKRHVKLSSFERGRITIVLDADDQLLGLRLCHGFNVREAA